MKIVIFVLFALSLIHCHIQSMPIERQIGANAPRFYCLGPQIDRGLGSQVVIHCYPAGYLQALQRIRMSYGSPEGLCRRDIWYFVRIMERDRAAQEFLRNPETREAALRELIWTFGNLTCQYRDGLWLGTMNPAETVEDILREYDIRQ